MEINKAKFDPYDTRVLFTKEAIDRQLEFAFRRPPINELPSIEIFKKVFGRQLKTWIGGSESRRFYVWTFQMGETVLYAMVHNVKGVCWEYPRDTNKINLEHIHKTVYKKLSEVWVK